MSKLTQLDPISESHEKLDYSVTGALGHLKCVYWKPNQSIDFLVPPMPRVKNFQVLVETDG